MAGTHVAFLRGINVGRAKRVAMADLRSIVEDLGYGDVRTLRSSGNVVFTARGAGAGAGASARIEEALSARCGVLARVTVVTAAELAAAAAGNPLLEVGTDHSRLFVAFLSRPADRTRLTPLAEQDWAPEALALGGRVAYLWCPLGVIASRLSEAVSHLLGDAVTTRNWATVTKLLGLIEV